MDEQTSAAPAPGVGQVMDIATPQQVIEPTIAPASPVESSNPPVLQPASVGSTIPVTEAQPAVAEAPSPVTPTITPETSAPIQPIINEQPVQEPPATSNSGETKPEDNKPVPDQPQPQKPHEPHKGAPTVAIVIAIIVAIGLAGVVIFAYMQSRNSDTIERTDTQSLTEKPQASVTDVDTASQEIDSELEKANDSTDFAANDLDDSTLGL